MNADFDKSDFRHKELTGKIIGCFYEVFNILGSGFLEKIYENALAFEFEKIGLRFSKQAPIRVAYKGEIMGEYFADFIVEDKIVVEIKALNKLSSVENAQLINYLKATGIEVGLLLNFGNEAEVKRRAFSGDGK